MWIVQERTVRNGKLNVRSLQKSSREKVDECLKEIAEQTAAEGYILAEQNENYIVLEKGSDRFMLTAYEAKPLDPDTTLSSQTYHFYNQYFLEVLRDPALGTAAVYLYDRDHPGAKVGTGKVNIRFTDEEAIAASIPTIQKAISTLEKK